MVPTLPLVFSSSPQARRGWAKDGAASKGGWRDGDYRLELTGSSTFSLHPLQIPCCDDGSRASLYTMSGLVKCLKMALREEFR